MVEKLVSFPRALLDDIEAYAERRRKEEPGATFSTNDAVRVLAHLGLAHVKRQDEQLGKEPTR
jgi:hypothetical protein